MIEKGGETIGGLRKMTQENPRKKDADTPILYFTVETLAPAVARAKELGAEMVGSRMDLGKERGAYQWIRDRENNLIALWAPQ